MTGPILFLNNSVDATNQAKRVDMFRRRGFEVEVAAFERAYNLGFGRLPDCPVTRLGRIPAGRYFSRLFRVMLALRPVRAAVRRNRLVYAHSPEMGLLAVLAGAGLGRRVVLDIADIVEIQVSPGLAGRIGRRLERWMLKRCGLLVLTSEGYRAYYRERLGSAVPIMVVENKLEPPPGAGTPAPAAPPSGRPLRVGWFGRLRDEWTVEVLEALARRPERPAIVIAGTPMPNLRDFERRVAGNPRFDWRGGYDYPDGLPGLYGEVDVAMNTYPPSVPSCWAQANRFYESCLYRRPQIARAGTVDGNSVARLGIGLVVDDRDPAAAAAAIARISARDVARWQAALAAVPPSVYILSEETDRLLEAVGGMIGPEAASPEPAV